MSSSGAPFHPQPAGKRMPQVMPMKVLEVGLSDCVIKPMNRIFERFARLARPKTLPRPLPRSKIVFKAASAESFSGTCTASSFFVREMFSIREFQSTMSHVRPYWLPFRNPVLIARSNSGMCEGHLAWTIFRSFFSSSSVSNRTRCSLCPVLEYRTDSGLPRDCYSSGLFAGFSIR